jgi:hypothetical protein
MLFKISKKSSVTGIVINIYTVCAIQELVTFMLTWNEARELVEGKKKECRREERAKK